jgi:hypothetical protein
MTREELVRIARRAADALETVYAPVRLRVVVIVTDASGDFVGVSSTTSPSDTDAILRCALANEGYAYHGDTTTPIPICRSDEKDGGGR